MRKIAFLMFVFTLLAGTSVYAQKLKNGTYRGSARGYSGEVSVKVVVSGGKIKDITVSGQSDRESAIKQIVSEIIREQNTNIDVVSGATVTSESIVFSVNNALRKKNDIVNVWEDEFKKKRLAVEEQKRLEEAERQRLVKAAEEEKERLAAEKLKQELQNPVTPAASEFKYDVASDGGVKITKYLGNSVSIKIPEKIEGLTVTEIENGAFDNSPIKKIVLPRIKKVALSGHLGLIEVILEDGWRYVPSFSDCTNLSKVIIPDSVTSIDPSAFQNCTSLSEIAIPDSVTRIESYAFQNCTSLSEIAIPDSVTRIESYAFGNCTSLSEIIIPDSVTSIGTGAFISCKNLTSVKLPPGLKKIENMTFGESGLKSIVIPNSVTDIDVMAFIQCKSLTSVTLPTNLKNVYGWAFAECDSLTEINIPENLQKVLFHLSGTVNIGGYIGEYKNRHIFEGCPNIPLATKSKLRELGYSGGF